MITHIEYIVEGAIDPRCKQFSNLSKGPSPKMTREKQIEMFRHFSGLQPSRCVDFLTMAKDGSSPWDAR
jgi:hypothetical protein